MLYDRASLAELIRRADELSCTDECIAHDNLADRIAAHALAEIENDVSDYVTNAVNEELAGDDW